jgi:hypothetical protein
MTEENTATFRNEGEPAFETDTENENSESSPDEKNESEASGASDQKDKKGDDTKEKPLNEHPRWAEREKEWNDKFSAQEERHKADVEALRSEFGGARKSNAEQTKIPSWFGGTQEQWDAYRSDRDAEIKAAEENAIKRIESAKTEEGKSVAEATAFMQSELTAIESDKTLNPSGAKVDPNKLLKFVLDNDLVDSQGRWNYRAGFRMMTAQAAPAPKTGNKKDIAAATTSESKSETKPPAFKTSADFKKSKPW